MADTDLVILRKPYPGEEEIVRRTMQDFSQYQTQRNLHAGQWEESASLILPTSRNTFFFGSYNWQGQKKTDRQIDASGALALHRFCAIADSLVTPRNLPWHGLEADQDYLMKNRNVALWYENAVRQIFKQRYKIYSGFSAQNYNGWQSVGAFGNATMFVDHLDPAGLGVRGLRYKSVPLGETFYGENHQGIVDRMIRWFRLTPFQAAQKWGEEALPPNLLYLLEQGSQIPTDYLHCVRPRDDDDYDPERLDEKGMPFISYYISLTGKCMMGPERGYRKFPYAVRRYDQTPGESYGRGPAQIVLPALKTLNAQKTTFLTQGHRAAAPVLLTTENGVIDFSLRPGALNPGGVSPDGKLLVHALPSGNIAINEKMMAMEQGLIEDTFMVSLFKVLSENPNMTATQVIELVAEKGMLVAPTLGRQHDEYVAKMVEREVDLLLEQRLLDPMPALLAEAVRAGMQHNTVDTSPLAKTARMAGDVGTIRMLETSKEIVNITQDMSYLDWFDGEVALPAMARNQSVPESYIADPRKQQMKAQQRARANAQRAQIESLPGQAAMINAQTKMQKGQPGVAPGVGGLGGPQR